MLFNEIPVEFQVHTLFPLQHVSQQKHFLLGRTEYISCFMSEKNPKGTRERGKKTQNEKNNTNSDLT